MLTAGAKVDERSGETLLRIAVDGRRRAEVEKAATGLQLDSPKSEVRPPSKTTGSTPCKDSTHQLPERHCDQHGRGHGETPCQSPAAGHGE